jgi:autotransporter translocation and assembly factor TamB
MRALRLFVLTILALVALIVVGLATPPGRAIVAGMIERAASSDGMTVSVGNLSGWPPFWLGADTIVLSDADGPFAEVDNLAVDVKFLALFTGSIALDSIAAERVMILRAPKLLDGGGDGALLPFAADRVSVARLELGAGLAGRPAALALEGSATVTAAGSIAAGLAAERIDGRAGTLSLSIDRATADAPLAVEIDIREAADGILVGLMGRPSGPGYALIANSRGTYPSRPTVRRASTAASALRRQVKAAGWFSTAPAISPNWCRRTMPIFSPDRSTWPWTPPGRRRPASRCRASRSARASCPPAPFMLRHPARLPRRLPTST